MLLVFVPKITNRIIYTFELCFNGIINLDYQLTDDITAYSNSKLPKIFYSTNVKEEEFFIQANDLLFTDIIIKRPKFDIIDGQVFFFPSDESSFYKFDVFAAVFWYVTRMEEYEFSVAERFLSKDSISGELNLVQIPIVNIWVVDFIKKLNDKYPEIKYSKPQFHFRPTIDVDSAFKYKYKSFALICFWYLHDFVKFDFISLKERFLTNINKRKDIWNCFDDINTVHKKYNYKPTYFFLLSKRSKFDKNISIHKKAMKEIIANLSRQGYEIGLYSSWRGRKNPLLWFEEKSNLEKILGVKVEKLRQHYIFIKFPDNYKKYNEMGIKEDYSLIYPDSFGFRTGTTVPVPFFDLTKNETTNLLLYPSVIMDVSLKNYQKKTISESKEIIDNLIKYYQEFGGVFISLWHNESLSEDKNWKELHEVYEYMLNKLSLAE